MCKSFVTIQVVILDVIFFMVMVRQDLQDCQDYRKGAYFKPKRGRSLKAKISQLTFAFMVYRMDPEKTYLDPSLCDGLK